jgi:hypothetical protein
MQGPAGSRAFLKMNIEGAEEQVFEDLAASGR